MKAVAFTTCLLVCSLPGRELPSSLFFEPNGGQAPADIDFIARTPDAVMHLRPDGAVLNSRVRMVLQNGRGTVGAGLDRLPGVSNYFRGADPSAWRSNIPQYSRVKYKDIYPGIDVIYYGTDRRLEYDFVVGPGVDPGIIQLRFSGADEIVMDGNGDLLITAAGDTIRQLRPRVYQQANGRKQEVASAYRIAPGGIVSFTLGQFDRSRELVIDPVIQYATYLGGAGQDTAIAVAVDSAGNAYVAGETTSGELATSGVFQEVRGGDQDVFVAKMSPTGALLFVTYLGGSKTETGLGIAVDEAGNSYIGGVTFSTDFPARNGVSTTLAGTYDAFVAKINSSGSQLLYATYLGGSAAEWVGGIAVDGQNGAWVTGWTTSRDFPLQRAYQGGSAGGGEDVFLTRLSPSGSTITYSTYFGGGGRDLSTSVAVDSAGAVYVSGATTSEVIPLANSAQPKPAGGQDAFIFKLTPATNTLNYSTFLGGTADEVAAEVALDATGSAHVVGYTTSANFPVSRTAAQTASRGGTDLFVMKISATGVVEYSTYLGGSGDDWAGGVAADAAGSTFISGWSNSADYPLRNPVQSQYAGGNISTQRYDAVVTRLAPNGDDLLYSTYLGGRGEDKAYAIGLDATGSVVIVGSTTSSDLPNAAGQFSASGPGVTDVFAAKLSADNSVSALAARPSSLLVSARSGDAVQPLRIELMSVGGALQFTTSASEPWLRVQPETGTTPMPLTVGIDTSALSAGTYRGEVRIHSLARTVVVPVVLNVILVPAIVSVSPSPIPRADHDVTITLSGGGYTAQSRVEINGTQAQTAYVDSKTLRVIVPGSATSQLGVLDMVVVNPDARSNPHPVQVTSGGPAILAGGVIHGASRTAGAIAPGQIVIVTGSGFGGDSLLSATPGEGRLGTVLAGTQVLFDDMAAPVLWTQPGQAAVLAPYGISGRSTTQVRVEHNGTRSAPVAIPVAASAPGLFTSDSSGIGQASALNENGTLNTVANPAGKGSVVVLYGTGEGLLSTSVGDGRVVSLTDPPRPALPVTVTIGGLTADVLYSGSAPGQVAGLLQLNVRIPQNVTPGPGVPVVVSVGANLSAARVVTLAVQ